MTNRKYWVFALSGLAALAFMATGSPSHAEQQGKAHKITVTGYVRDTACFIMKGASGASHEQCALTCAKNGIPLGIQADNGTYYLAVGPGHPAKPGNPLLEKYAEKKVKITGIANVRNGMHVLAVMKVQPL